MADTYGPFDNVPWAEAQWYTFAPAWAPDGVLGAGELSLTTSGLSVTLGAGRAWVGGAGFQRVAPLESLTVPSNSHSTYSRRDRLVLRRSRTAKTVLPFILQGSPASSPALPALSQDLEGNWDLPLWNFLTPPANGTTLTSLTDERFVSLIRPMAMGSTLPTHVTEGAIFFLVN